MSDSPDTRPSLLVRIRQASDGEAWSQFVEIYAPLVYGFYRRHGLQDADAADLTRDVLCAVAKTARDLDYDPRRGSFRGWLFTVAQNKLRNFVTRRDPRGQGTGNSDVQRILQEQPAREEQDSWDHEYEQRLFGWAADQVRRSVEESTWQAFWQTAVQGNKPSVVAKELGMTVANVYRAKNRVMNRLKEQVRQLEETEDQS